MLLSIIILSYNTKDLTIACIESVFKQYRDQLESGEFEVIVVDNSSSDQTVGAIGQLSNWAIKLIVNKENYGFAKGNNIGARKARGKYIFFLNSDTQLVDDGLLRMVEFMDGHLEVGVLGGKLISGNGSIEKSAGKIYDLVRVFIMLFLGERLDIVRFAPKNTSRVDWVSGASMLVRGEIFKKISGFDENFFMYVEDMEFCLRAAKEGFQTCFYSDISINHKMHGSSNRSFAMLNIYKGLLYFYKKHSSYLEYTVVKLFLAIKAYMAIGIGLITNNSYLVYTYRKALLLL